MRKVIVNTFLTLDGVMQGPGLPDEDREGGFERGGWQMPYFDEVAASVVQDGMTSSGGFLLGRKTYEIFAEFWPNAPDDDPGAAMMNAIPKFVASTTLEEPLAWNNSTLLKGDIAEAVNKLKHQPGKNLDVIGSGGFAQTLMHLDLVDEYQLMIHPIVLGSGKRLFDGGLPIRTLELVDTKTTSTGVVILIYRAAEKAGGDPASG
nr:dihydrofolate reductase [Actinomycetota bacterium]